MEEIFAVVKTSTGEVLWASLCSPERAEAAALVAAVGHGGVNLLSGSDLGHHLIAGPW